MYLLILIFCPLWFVLHEINATYPTVVATVRKFPAKPWKTEYG